MSSPQRIPVHEDFSQTRATSYPQQDTNLIINYLPPSLTEEDFLELFSLLGPIVSFRMMKNDDGTPRGYGFVRFQYPAHARKAIQMYNGYELWGKRLKVAYTRTGGPRENCNIFTTNLPASWTTSTLFEKFGKFGEILEARILTDSHGRSRLCGFIRFDNTEAAVFAIEQFNMHVPVGAYRPIKVRLARRQAEHWKMKGVGPYSKEKAELLRKGGKIQQNLMRQKLQQDTSVMANAPRYPSSAASFKKTPISSSNPSVSDVIAPFSTNTHPPAPVPQITPIMESSVLQTQNPLKLENVVHADQNSLTAIDANMPELSVDPEAFESSASVGFRLFMCNIPTFFSGPQIKNFCEKYGKVIECKIQKSNENASLGMCFVTYSTKEEVLAAQKALDKCEIYNQEISAMLVD